MAIGTVIGTLLDIDRQLNRLAAWVEARFKRKNDQVTLAEGFVAASLLFCVGAMTIVGSLQAGLTGDCEMLYTKAALDLISSCVLAASLGFGVLLAGVFVLGLSGRSGASGRFCRSVSDRLCHRRDDLCRFGADYCPRAEHYRHHED